MWWGATHGGNLFGTIERPEADQSERRIARLACTRRATGKIPLNSRRNPGRRRGCGGTANFPRRHVPPVAPFLLAM